MDTTTLLAFALFANTLTYFVSASNVEPVAHLENSQQTTHLVDKLHQLHEQLLLVSSIPWVLEKVSLHELEVLTTLGKLVRALGETHAHEKLFADSDAQALQDQSNDTAQYDQGRVVEELEVLKSKHERLLKKLFDLLAGDVAKLEYFFPLVFDTAFLEGLKEDWQSDVTKLKELLHLLTGAFEVVALLQNSNLSSTGPDFPVFDDFLKHLRDLGLLLDLGVGLDFLLHQNDQQKKLTDKLLVDLHNAPTFGLFLKSLKTAHSAGFGSLVGWEGVSHPFADGESWDFDALGEVAFVHKLVNDGLTKRKNDVLGLFRSRLNDLDVAEGSGH